MTNKIVVFDAVEIERIDEFDGFDDDVRRSRNERMRGSPSTAARQVVRAMDVEFDQLSDNLLAFVNNVRDMLGKVADHAGNFSVETVEVQAQISGEGKVGFLGSGVKASGGATIKIVLERRKEQGSVS